MFIIINGVYMVFMMYLILYCINVNFGKFSFFVVIIDLLLFYFFLKMVDFIMLGLIDENKNMVIMNKN